MITEKDILKFLNKHISNDISTLQPQGLDRLDFREVSITTLINIIKSSYQKGYEDCFEDGFKVAE